ncbi:MAG: ATP phosphoribosyltransferase [Prevotellaceae bacterium]|jgi:ATP phosphoribosyltransferase|nr:ATP phosphoribosyltransferase [Prevotellaceae bacterium]
MLKIAIPYEDNFTKQTVEQLVAAGVRFEFSERGAIVFSEDFPAQISMMSYAQIISSISTGIQDVGIVGEHHVKESSLRFNTVHKFNSSKTNLSISVNNNFKYNGLDSLSGKKIATPFPNIATSFFKGKNIRVLTVNCPQDTENSVILGLADAVLNVVQPKNSRLKEVETVLQSSPLLIANQNLSPAKQMFLDELLDRISSVQNAFGKKMLRITAKMKNIKQLQKTLSQLDNSLMVMSDINNQNAVFQLIIDKKQLWDMKAHLQTLGAESIMVLPLENFIF